MKRWSRVHIRAVENAVIVLELKAVEKHGGENAEVWHCVDFFFSESQHWLSWRTQTVGDGVKPWWRRSKLVTQDQFREIDDLCSVLCDRNQSCRPFPESKHHLNQHNLSKTTFICVLFFSFSVALTSLKAPARRRVEMILLLQPKKTAWKQTFFFFSNVILVCKVFPSAVFAAHLADLETPCHLRFLSSPWQSAANDLEGHIVPLHLGVWVLLWVWVRVCVCIFVCLWMHLKYAPLESGLVFVCVSVCVCRPVVLLLAE